MKKITVYVKKGFCPQCDATKSVLNGLNLPYETIEIDEDITSLLKGVYGYTAAPVVSINDFEEHWSGFRIDLLEALA